MNASGLGHGRDVDLTMLIVVSLVTELKTLPAIFRILAPSKGSCLLEAIMDMAIPLDLSESRQISTTYQKKRKKKYLEIFRSSPSDILFTFQIRTKSIDGIFSWAVNHIEIPIPMDIKIFDDCQFLIRLKRLVG